MIEKQDTQRAVLVFFQSEAVLKDFINSGKLQITSDITVSELTGKNSNEERDQLVKDATN